MLIQLQDSVTTASWSWLTAISTKNNQVDLLSRGHLNKSGYVNQTLPRVETSEETQVLGQGHPLQVITIQMLPGCAASLCINNNGNESRALSNLLLLLQSLDKGFQPWLHTNITWRDLKPISEFLILSYIRASLWLIW